MLTDPYRSRLDMLDDIVRAETPDASEPDRTLAAAAKILGVTYEELRSAVEYPGPIGAGTAAR